MKNKILILTAYLLVIGMVLWIAYIMFNAEVGAGPVITVPSPLHNTSVLSPLNTGVAQNETPPMPPPLMTANGTGASGNTTIPQPPPPP